jgi:FAD/FMN-containing dehydrogenase
MAGERAAGLGGAAEFGGAAGLGGAAFRTFRGAFGGEIVTPSDDGYDDARRVWNGMIDRRPALIVRPLGVADVTSAIRFGREQGLAIAVRSGGHSLPGLSVCDDGLVIDMSRIKGATVDRERRTARVGGGALLAELDDAAQAVGLACPVGVVSHTGVAGLTLGGGVGRLQRRLGLTIDNLRAVELVTAEGRVVRASAEESPDLFWGLRGAGWNFGIATAFEFDLHPVGPILTRARFMHPLSRAAEAFAFFRDYMARAPWEISGLVTAFQAVPAEDFPPAIAGGPIAVISVTYCGRPEDAERDLAPLRTFGPPVATALLHEPYLQVQRMFDADMAWGIRNYAKSVYVDAAPDALIEAMVALAPGLPVDGSVFLGALGGAIAEVPEDATAYAGRAAAFEAGVDCAWEDPGRDAERMGWARGAMKGIEPFRTTGVYANALGDSGEEVARAIYGDAKYERLRALKRTWDPDNVFHLNQNIRP